MGLSMSDAIRLTLVRIADEKRIPFELRVPNAETLEACRELKDGRGQSYASADEMYKDLGI
jgi:DNA-damage-inducible protein J